MSSTKELALSPASKEEKPSTNEDSLGNTLDFNDLKTRSTQRPKFRSKNVKHASYASLHFKTPSVVQPVLVDTSSTDVTSKGYLPSIFQCTAIEEHAYDVIPYSRKFIVYDDIQFVLSPSDFKQPDIPDSALWSLLLLPNVRPKIPVLDKTVFVQCVHARPYTAYKDYFTSFSDVPDDKFGTVSTATITALKPVVNNYLYLVDPVSSEAIEIRGKFQDIFDMSGKYADEFMKSNESLSIYDFAFLVANSYYYSTGRCNTQITLEQLRYATVSAYIGILLYPFAFVRFSAKDFKALYKSLTSEVLNEFINNGAYVLMKALSNTKFIGMETQPSAWGCFVLGLYATQPTIATDCILQAQMKSFHSSRQTRMRIKQKGVKLTMPPDQAKIREKVHNSAYSEAIQSLKKNGNRSSLWRPVGFAASDDDGNSQMPGVPVKRKTYRSRDADEHHSRHLHHHHHNQRPSAHRLTLADYNKPGPETKPKIQVAAPKDRFEAAYTQMDRAVGQKTKVRFYDDPDNYQPEKVTTRNVPNFAPITFKKQKIDIAKFRAKAMNSNNTTISVNKRKGTPFVADDDEDVAYKDIGFIENYISNLKNLPTPPEGTGLSYIPPNTSSKKLLAFIQNQILAFINVKHLDGIEDEKLQMSQKAVYNAHIDKTTYSVFPSFLAAFNINLVLNSKSYLTTQQITAMAKSSLPKDSQPMPIQLVGPIENRVTACSDGTFNNHIEIPISAPLFTNTGKPPTKLDEIQADYKPIEFVPAQLSHGQTPTNDKLLYQFITGNGMKLPAVRAIADTLAGEGFEDSDLCDQIRSEILDYITKFAKYPGTIVGQLCRFGLGLSISHKSCRSVDDPHWIRPHFDIIPLIDIYNNSIDDIVRQFTTSNLVRTNDGASTGMMNQNQKRDLLTDIMDAQYFKTWMTYRLVFEAYYSDPEHRKEEEYEGDKVLYNLGSVAEMKPKDEVVERMKAFIKSRTIFVLNACTQLPFNVALSVGERFEGRAMESFKEPCLLGIDAQVCIRNLLRVLIDRVSECAHDKVPFSELTKQLQVKLGLDCPYLWYSYSDNCYCLNLENFTLTSYDGEKMESSVKGDDLEDCMRDMFGEDDILFEFELPAPQLKFFERTNHHSKVINDVTYAEFEIKCAPPDPGFEPLHVNPANLALSPATDFTTPLARQLYSGSKVWLKIKDHELYTTTVKHSGNEFIHLYGIQGPSVWHQPQAWYISYKKAMKDLVDNTICVLGPSAFKSSFLPSGARFTSIINTYKTLGTVLFLREQRASPQWFAEHLPTSWVVKVESVADLRPILFEKTCYESQLTEKPKNNQIIRTDFLGFDVLRMYDHWAVVLRRSALFPNPFYHQYYSKSGSLDSQRNEVALYLSVIINGGIYYLPMFAAMLARVPFLAKEALVSLDQIAIMLSVLGVRDVDLSFVTKADNIWANVFTMAYNRSILTHDQEFDNKINDCANILSAMIESIPVVEQTINIRTLQSICRKAIIKATNQIVGSEEVSDPLPAFMQILTTYLDQHRQVSGVPVVLSLFVAVLFQYYLSRFKLDYAKFANRVQKATADQLGLETAQEVSDSIVVAA